MFIHDTTWIFASEIILRCVCMYVLIIVFLRLTGKRGVRQLSIFEVAILLALGSISGDPMFDNDIPLLHAVMVMSVIVIMYRITTWLMMKYQPFEDLIEGKALYIVEDGVLVLETIKKGKMSYDEFFAEMRQQGVEHLGQIHVGLLETDGKLSLLFYPPEDVHFGLPIFPKQAQPVTQIRPDTYYACGYCGYIAQPQYLHSACIRCANIYWTLALNTQRLT